MLSRGKKKKKKKMRKECPNYINSKGKAMNTTLSDYESSNSVDGSDSEGNFTAFTVLADVIGEKPGENFVEVVKKFSRV